MSKKFSYKIIKREVVLRKTVYSLESDTPVSTADFDSSMESIIKQAKLVDTDEVVSMSSAAAPKGSVATAADFARQEKVAQQEAPKGVSFDKLTEDMKLSVVDKYRNINLELGAGAVEWHAEVTDAFKRNLCDKGFTKIRLDKIREEGDTVAFELVFIEVYITKIIHYYRDKVNATALYRLAGAGAVFYDIAERRVRVSPDVPITVLDYSCVYRLADIVEVDMVKAQVELGRALHSLKAKLTSSESVSNTLRKRGSLYDPTTGAIV